MSNINQNKNANTFTDSIFVKNTLYTNKIAPRNGNSLVIEGLDLSISCLKLTDDNTSVGCNTGNSLTTGVENTLIGNVNANLLTTGTGNVSIGYKACENMISASDNVVIGRRAGNRLNNGTKNVMIGNSAGLSLTSGIDNIFIGTGVATSATTGKGNTIMGTGAGSNLTTGENNTLLGISSGSNITTQSSCVLIGKNAGTNNTQDNRLMVDISDTDDPLIDGNFVNQKVRINNSLETGNLDITNELKWSGNLVNSSSPVEATDLIPIKIGNLTRYIRLFDI